MHYSRTSVSALTAECCPLHAEKLIADDFVGDVLDDVAAEKEYRAAGYQTSSPAERSARYQEAHLIAARELLLITDCIRGEAEIARREAENNTAKK